MAPVFLRSSRLAVGQCGNHSRCVVRLAAVSGLVSIGFAVASSIAVLHAADVAKVADPEKAATPQPAGSADAAFRAVIELVGLCEHPSAGHDWWRPDGSPLGKIPTGEAPKNLTSRHVFDVRLGDSRALDRDIAIDARLPEGGEVELIGRNLNGSGSASTFQKSGDKKVLQSLRIVAQFEPNSRATLVVHYVPAPWQTDCEFKVWNTRRGKRVRSGSGMVAQGTRTSGVIMARPTEENGFTAIVASFDLDDVEHRDVRIVAVDKAGLTLHAQRWTQSDASHAHMHMAIFDNTPLEKIETFLFQSRKFQSVAFRNVSLHRGQKTNFAVHVGDEPVEQTAPSSPRRGRSAAKKSEPSSKAKPDLPHAP
jgi:hypothetical protein